MSDLNVVRIRHGAAIALALASLVTLAAFGWPFVIQAHTDARASSHGSDAPWIFALILPLMAAIVLAELNAGGIDSKAIALLGMMSAVGGALRALSPGVAGMEPTFVVVILGGRVFGRGFGFVLGCLSLFIGALITGGVGPWLPFQMMAAGWVGFLAGCLPRVPGRLETWMLAGVGFVLGLLFGLLMNLWFWPFGQYGDQLSFVDGASTASNLAAYLRYYFTTSIVWDLARGISTFLLLALTGRPLLRALRRVARRAAFDAVATFEPSGTVAREISPEVSRESTGTPVSVTRQP